MAQLVIDNRERNTILAALRCYQVELESPPYPKAEDNAIATNEFQKKPLSIDDIDRLCERINCS